MPLVSITKTFKVPAKPPTGGGEPGVPTQPIYIPVVPSFPIVIPPEPPPVINEPVFPTHPIYIPIGGEKPPEGGSGEKPEISLPIYLPVYPAHPIVIPPDPVPPGSDLKPTHPIVIPPDEVKPLPPEISLPIYWPVYPDNSLPVPPGSETPPPVISGPDDPRPTHPIYIPIAPPTNGGGEHPSQPIYIPVYPSNALPEVPGPVDPGYGIPEEGLPHPDHTLPGQQPGAGLKPENPIVLPPIDLPEGQTTIYVSLTPGVPVEVNVPAGSRRRKK